MMAMDEDRRRPISRNRPPARPEVRPVAIWVITAALVLIGLLFTYGGVTAFVDAIDHGDEDAQLPSLIGVLIGLLTILFAGGLFFGATWGRSGALVVLGVVFLGAIVSLMAEAVSTGAVMIAFVVTLCLFFALLGQKAHDWTNGVPRSTRRRPDR